MDDMNLKAMGIIDDNTYCKNCGKVLKNEEKEYCNECKNKTTNNENFSYDTSYFSVNCICFLIPIIGFIGYIVHIKNDYSLAKKCFNSAIWGIICYIFFIIIFLKEINS